MRRAVSIGCGTFGWQQVYAENEVTTHRGSDHKRVEAGTPGLFMVSVFNRELAMMSVPV